MLNYLEGIPWGKAVKAARGELKLTGFVPVGGKTGSGKRLHEVAKAHYEGAHQTHHEEGEVPEQVLQEAKRVLSPNAVTELLKV